MNYQSLFANPAGRTSRGRFVGALIVLLLVAAFYYFLVKAGRNGEWVLFTLLYPAFVLHARRLHDMGRTAWLLIIPGALFAAAIWLLMISGDARLGGPVTLSALAVSAAAALWGLIGKGQADANRFGEPAA
jgi:uncharacterized membrane protein YhaH (DUF805 family)